MATNRSRRVSPPPYRRYPDPRASTGTVISSSFDPRVAQYPRASADTLATPRSYDAQPITKRIYQEPGYSGGTKSRTEYAVRPRTNSAAADERRPPSIVIPPHSPARSRPLVNNLSRDRARSPLPKLPHPRDDSDRYIYPAVSSPRQHHQRHYSTTPVDLEHLQVTDNDRRERARYRDRGTGGYTASGALVRYRDDDVSYTGPREQFDRDYPSVPPTRRDSYPRRERPLSALDFAEWKPPRQAKRESGPPPSAFRQFDRIEKADTGSTNVSGGGISDHERNDDTVRRRHSMRVPVSLHQDRDPGPARQRDDLGDRRDPRPRRGTLEEEDIYNSDRDHRDHQHASSHHERRNKKHRDESPTKTPVGEKVAAVGLGGVAAAGLAGGMSKPSRDNDVDEEVDQQRERRHRRRRDREFEEADVPPGDGVRSERPRDRLHDLQEEQETDDPRRGKGSKDRADSDSLEDDVARNRHRRRKHRSKDDSRQDADSASGSESRNVREKSRDVRGRDDLNDDPELNDGERRRRERDRRPDPEQPSAESAGHEGVPGELEDDRPRRVQLVEPPKEKDQEPKPKGILKPPRATPFPEDPNPTREGVAPLKEATKKGIPPGARWTKINRQLVNPASLEASRERYEERDDYVIVLRVLTREEIEKFAALTAEIRGKWNVYLIFAFADRGRRSPRERVARAPQKGE